MVAKNTKLTKSFSDSYKELENMVETLENSSEQDLETVLDIVPKAIENHKFCKNRIEEIRKIIESKLDN